MLVVFNGMIQGVQDRLFNKEVIWDKTERFEEAGGKRKEKKTGNTKK